MTRNHLQHLTLITFFLAGCASTAPHPADDEASNEPHAATLDARMQHELMERFPGVRMYRDAGGLQIRIRGALEPPLYIVDGMPVTNTPGGGLWGISPYEIERIEVIKDLGRLARYGIRGANGVVMITTKSR